MSEKIPDQPSGRPEIRASGLPGMRLPILTLLFLERRDGTRTCAGLGALCSAIVGILLWGFWGSALAIAEEVKNKRSGNNGWIWETRMINNLGVAIFPVQKLNDEMIHDAARERRGMLIPASIICVIFDLLDMGCRSSTSRVSECQQ